MTSKAEENAERIRVQRNDKAVREGSTLSAFAQADASLDRGRYSQAEHLKPKIVQGGPDYPKLPPCSPWAQPRDPDEPAIDCSAFGPTIDGRD
jgi:hypothetical protein